jgi:hypothetical protein
MLKHWVRVQQGCMQVYMALTWSEFNKGGMLFEQTALPKLLQLTVEDDKREANKKKIKKPSMTDQYNFFVTNIFGLGVPKNEESLEGNLQTSF